MIDRASVISTYLVELVRRGLPKVCGPLDREVVFILDGVGGFQFVPLLARKVIRESGEPIGTIMYRWQFGLPGEVFTDLCWYTRNCRKGRELAELIVAFHVAHPQTIIHIVALSGGCGIAIFACEALAKRAPISTLIMACPALSPTYNLAPALREVECCFALVSERDTVLLGLGTRIFGTTDRVRCDAAGQVGFQIPPDATDDDRAAYRKLHEVHWTPAMREDIHSGGHTGWANPKFLRKYLIPLLHGELPSASPSKSSASL
ncbi:MAG: hypothetical protein HY287_10650 [Planctomycetes bacterium]|nr:hypothetical protein [Planctomycetota bacterium]